MNKLYIALGFISIVFADVCGMEFDDNFVAKPVQQLDDEGRHLFDYVSRNNFNSLEMCIQVYGKDLEIDKRWGVNRRTLLGSSIVYDNRATMQLLLSYGASVNQICYEDTPPIILAMRHGSDGLVAALLGHQQLDINAVDAQGNTPLHALVLHTRNTFCNICLRLGATINQKNNSGITPFDLAQQFNREIISLFESYQLNNNDASDKVSSSSEEGTTSSEEID